jgi:hypothetical protein
MISPVIGASANAISISSRRDIGLQPPGTSRPNIALLEAMQAGRVTSALFSSLMVPSDSFFKTPSPATFMPPAQSTPQRPSLSLLESMQAGKATSALISSMMGLAPGVRSFQDRAVFTNPQAALTNAQDIIRAVGTGQPSLQGDRVAHTAYLMEIQAQKQVDQRSMGSNLMREWFA